MAGITAGWFSVIHDENGAKADDIVQWFGHEDDAAGHIRYWVRWPREGHFKGAFISKDNLLPELPPDAWLADEPDEDRVDW
jgi:hypothetical protein